VSNRIVIEPGAKSRHYWRDIWNYRGLFYFLAWRDVLVRYKQTVIGLAWSVTKPLFTILVMWFIGWFFQSPIPSGVPRILLVSAAALPWQFFSSAFSEMSNSLVGNSNLLSKVYFPRLIVPLSTLIVALIDFLVSLGILVIIMCLLRFMPDWKIIFLPFFLLLAIVTTIGTGLFIASLNVKYRDFRIIVPFIVQLGLYACPIAYSSDSIYQSTRLPEAFKFIYSLNPMVGVIDGFRWCIIGNESHIYLPGFVLSVIISLLFLVTGIWYFRKTEHSFADVI
jgi:lipopolysaccharide transport system permease protein